MNSIIADKNALRRTMLHSRSACDQQVMGLRSRLCQANLLESRLWRKACSVALYAAIAGETETALLLEAALQTGKKLFLPRITSASRHEMRFAQCHSLADLVPGIWKIPEPPAGPEPQNLDLIILPGLAFDLTGNRLGYGGGYYDRYLADLKMPGVYLIGLCHFFQIVASVPAMEWDVRVDAICTEEGIQWT